MNLLRTKGRPSFKLAKTYLELGANPHATNGKEHNTIQCAMFSALSLFESDRRTEDFRIVQDKLELLIRAGVNLEHRDSWGRTLSQTARQYGCWEIWCDALKNCGKSVEELGPAVFTMFDRFYSI